MRAAFLGVLQFFEHDHAGPFAEDEAVAVEVERPATAFGGSSLRVREGGEQVEAGDAEGVDHAVRAAGEHHVGVAVADDLGRLADGLAAGGAGGQAVVVRAFAASKSSARCPAGVCISCSASRGQSSRAIMRRVNWPRRLARRFLRA